jgi:hypothetical protein
MNQDQIMGLLRQFLPIIGGIAVTLGWISPEAVASLTAKILAISGPVVVIVGLVWSWIANKPTSVAASMGASPGTTVTPAANGTATVTIVDKDMAQAALQAQAKAA